MRRITGNSHDELYIYIYLFIYLFIFIDLLLTCRVFRKVHPSLGSEFLTAYHEVLQILRMKNSI